MAGFMATFVVYGVLLLPLSPIELLAGPLSLSNPYPEYPTPTPIPTPNPYPYLGFLFPFWTALAICVAGKVASLGEPQSP